MERITLKPKLLPELYPGLNVYTARIHELVKSGRLTHEIGDGMDGAGKKTLTDTIQAYVDKAIPGVHALKFTFPAYETPIGQVITKLLYSMEFRATLPLLDRMILYSLNRLEVLPQLQKQILSASNEGAVFCLFDRLFPSSLVTVAAYATELIPHNQLQNYYSDRSAPEHSVSAEVHRLEALLEPGAALATCWNLERFIFQALGIERPHVVMLLNDNIELALNQIAVSRQSQDLNEQTPIQYVTKAYYRWFSASNDCLNFNAKEANGENWKSSETVVKELLPQLSLPKNTSRPSGQQFLFDQHSPATIKPADLAPVAIEMGASDSLVDLLLSLPHTVG
jgi:thymidylate kinase